MAWGKEIPLYGNLVNKFSAVTTVEPFTKDIYGFSQYPLNIFYDVHRNSLTRTADIWMVGRPGFTRINTNIVASNNAQGLYYWSQDQKVYIVVNGSIYNTNTTVPVTSYNPVGALPSASATQGCWFDEFYDGTNYMLLVKCEDGNLYTVTTAGVITQVTDTDYTGLSAVGQIAVLKGYVFAVDSTGKLANSDLNAPTAWTATNYLRADSMMDKAKAVMRSGDIIACFGEYSIQFFDVAGNPFGSILSEIPNSMKRIGCVSHKMIYRYGDDIFFVGKTVEGGPSVYRLKGTQVEEIATPDIKRYLAIWTEIGVAGIIPMEGHVFYVVSADTSAYTVSAVYDITEPGWTFWNTFDGISNTPTSRPFFWLTQGSQVCLQSSGSINQDCAYVMATNTMFGLSGAATQLAYYQFGARVYTDGGQQLYSGFQMDDMDFGTGNLKIINAVRFNGRKLASAITSFAYTFSFNGGASWATSRSLDASKDEVVSRMIGPCRKLRQAIFWTGGYWAVRTMQLDMDVCLQ